MQADIEQYRINQLFAEFYERGLRGRGTYDTIVCAFEVGAMQTLEQGIVFDQEDFAFTLRRDMAVSHHVSLLNSILS
jgi:hypothetical protein